MDRWQRLWYRLLKDVALTGLGGWAIFSQISSAHPSPLVIGTGLALTVPSVADHVRALLPSPPGGGESSPSSPSPGGQVSRDGSSGE